MIRELRDLFSREVIQLQTYQHMGQDNSLQAYRDIRAQEELLFRELGPIAERAGDQGIDFRRALVQLARRWHSPPPRQTPAT